MAVTMAQNFPSRPADIAESLRQAMRQVVSSVTVITANAHHAPVGMTATAVTMVSLEPPTILACVNRAARLHDAVCVSRQFRIAFLDQQHCDIAKAFGGAVQHADRFSADDWRTDVPFGPRLRGALVNIGCDLEQRFDFGTHSVFVGLVRSVDCEEGDALLYGEGGYCHVPGLKISSRRSVDAEPPKAGE